MATGPGLIINHINNCRTKDKNKSAVVRAHGITSDHFFCVSCILHFGAHRLLTFMFLLPSSSAPHVFFEEEMFLSIICCAVLSYVTAETMQASDARVNWSGRRSVNDDASVTFDWLGVSTR